MVMIQYYRKLGARSYAKQLLAYVLSPAHTLLHAATQQLTQAYVWPDNLAICAATSRRSP